MCNFDTLNFIQENVPKSNKKEIHRVGECIRNRPCRLGWKTSKHDPQFYLVILGLLKKFLSPEKRHCEKNISKYCAFEFLVKNLENICISRMYRDYVCIHKHSQTQTQTQLRTHTQTQSHKQTLRTHTKPISIHKHKHKVTRLRTHTQTQSHTHTHKHTGNPRAKSDTITHMTYHIPISLHPLIPETQVIMTYRQRMGQGEENVEITMP